MSGYLAQGKVVLTWLVFLLLDLTCVFSDIY